MRDARHHFRAIQVAAYLAAAAAALSLCACQSVSESQTTSLVRVVDASYNAPAVDVYAGKTEIAKNVAAGTITDYAILAPGAVTITVDPAGAAQGKTKPLATLTANLPAAGQHSVYLADAGTGFDATLLPDQTESAPIGEFAVRFLQSAQAPGAVDIYYLAQGESLASARPVVRGLGAGQSSGYVDVANGSYQLVVTRAGSKTPLYTSSSVTYAGGEVRTVLIQAGPLSQELASHAQSIRVVVGDDLN